MTFVECDLADVETISADGAETFKAALFDVLIEYETSNSRGVKVGDGRHGEIHELNGGAETGTNKTGGSIRFKMADNATVDLADPIPVPSSGTAYSMQKWLRMNVSGTCADQHGSYTDGGNGFGSGCKMWVKTPPPTRRRRSVDLRRSAAPFRR